MDFSKTTIFFFAGMLMLLAVGTTGAEQLTAVSGPKGQAVGVRWGFYVTYNPNSLASLQANAPGLNYVSPWYFNVNAEGQVTGRDQPAASDIIRAAGARSLPMLKNGPQYDAFTRILTDTRALDLMVTQIQTLINANGYDGITIDFEGLNANDKPLLTAFMGKLYAALHPQGKLVAMAVAAKVRDTNFGWAGAYDYPALALVTDYILVMAYDYHWATGDPGPVAPMNKLRDSADYTVSRIPPAKVIWGVGVYGYDWPVSAPGKASGRGDSRTYAEASTIGSLPGAVSGYDEAAQAPYVRYTQGSQTREVWYENRRSFEAKLGLIRQYNMAGFGIWRLGQEDPGVWEVMAGNSTPTVTPGRTSTPTFTATATAIATSTPAPPTPTPTPQPPAACRPVQPFPSTEERIYFGPTGHSLGGLFLQHWQQHGGLPLFGYPLTEEFTEVSQTDGRPYRVQYFERNRFELHPENTPPNNVELGLLGVQAYANRTMPLAPPFDTDSPAVYFPQVGHNLGGPFLRYWQQHGGVAFLGYPITEPVLERDPHSGRTYTVQYLERARLERHPEYAGSEAEVLLGLLGLNVLPCR